MHHSPKIDFDSLAPAVRQSALRALHKHDSDSVIHASSSGAGPVPSSLQVQSACIPGCVQLLLAVRDIGDRVGQQEWAAGPAGAGLASALYQGVYVSPEGGYLGKVVVQVGEAVFVFEGGVLLEGVEADEEFPPG